MLTTLATTAGLLGQVVFPGGLLSVAILFFLIAIVAYVLRARGVAGNRPPGIGRTLLFVFLVLAIIFAIVGSFDKDLTDTRNRPRHDPQPSRVAVGYGHSWPLRETRVRLAHFSADDDITSRA